MSLDEIGGLRGSFSLMHNRLTFQLVREFGYPARDDCLVVPMQGLAVLVDGADRTADARFGNGDYWYGSDALWGYPVELCNAPGLNIKLAPDLDVGEEEVPALPSDAPHTFELVDPDGATLVHAVWQGDAFSACDGLLECHFSGVTGT